MGNPGIYIHIPFCRKKCIYCDFTSYAGREDCFEAFGDAMVREIGLKGAAAGGRVFDSVFIGGGTPSVLPERILGKIAAALFGSFNIDADCEFTVEANPGTVNLEKLKYYRALGVNRISFGVQSTDGAALKMLGRIHGRREIFEAFEDAARAGFRNVNADLIFGLPGEQPGSFERTLEEVLALGPAHISAYSLIVEPDTPLCDKIEKGVLPEPSETTDRGDYHMLRQMLRGNGFRQYEISNFARPGRESRHNCKYWNQDEYVGLGPAAASFLEGVRFVNADSLEAYIGGDSSALDAGKKSLDAGGKSLDAGGSFEDGNFEDGSFADGSAAHAGFSADGAIGKSQTAWPVLKESVRLTRKELMDEYMLLGMRFTDGPDFAGFAARYGEDPFKLYGESLRRLEEGGYIARSGSGRRPFALTDKGLDFANIIFGEFV
ncbi:MAG: radical SAM family heme chaperone HemW [Clostridia bacterium]|nr:radical SAM family heme chaperone HemW [Clostridia bacterium]